VSRYLPGLVLSMSAVIGAAQGQPGLQEGACHGCLSYYHNAEGKTNLLEDVGLDREEDRRTILLNTSGYDKLHLIVFYTYATATDLFVKVACSTGTPEFVPRSEDALESAGANQRFLLSYDVTGCVSTRVVFSASRDASGSDVVTVQAVGQSTARPESLLPVQ
jgi:hypothetical protein